MKNIDGLKKNEKANLIQLFVLIGLIVLACLIIIARVFGSIAGIVENIRVFSIGAELVSLIFASILFIVVIFNPSENKTIHKNFLYLNLIVILQSGSYALLNTRLSVSPKDPSVYFFTTIILMANILAEYLFFNFVLNYYSSNQEKYKNIKNIFRILVTIVCILIIINCFNHFIVSYDNEGNRNVSAIFPIIMLPLAICIIAGTIVISKLPMEDYQKRVLLTTPFIQALCSIVDIKIGWCSIPIGLLITVFLLYFIIYEKASRELDGKKKDLQLASEIQLGLLPQAPLIKQSEVDVDAYLRPAKEVGGDFYDYFMKDDEHLWILIADVSDKGVPASLFMARGMTAIRSGATIMNSPAEVFTSVNKILCSGNPNHLFITAWVGELNIKTGEIIYVNAGHEVPFLINSKGEISDIKDNKNLVLGFMDTINYKESKRLLNPGEKIFLYTDGLTDARNIKNESFGRKAVEEVLRKNYELLPEKLVSTIREDVDNFMNLDAQFDDLTIMCCKFK